MNKKYFKFLFFLSFILILPKKVQAIPPPEIINNFGILLLQIITMVSAGLASFFYFLKKTIPKYINIKIGLPFLLLVIVMFSGFLFYHQKNKILSVQQIVLTPPNETNTNIRGLKPSELKTLLDEKADIVLFDSRLKEEFEVGHLLGAINNNATRSLVDGIGAETLTSSLGTGTLAIFYCQDGARSKIIADYFSQFHPNTAYVDGWPMNIDEYWQGDTINWEVEKIIDNKTAQKYIKNGALILDPRNQKDFYQSHAEKAVNIPVSEINHYQTLDHLNNLNLEKGFLVVCYDKISCFEAFMLNYRINVYFQRQKIETDNYFLGILAEHK